MLKIHLQLQKLAWKLKICAGEGIVYYYSVN